MFYEILVRPRKIPYEILVRPRKIPYEISPAKVYLANLSPPELHQRLGLAQRAHPGQCEELRVALAVDVKWYIQ